MDEIVTSQVFNDADADVIFRSSDGVHFHLHKLILSKASSVFQGMFTLPSAPSHETAAVQVVQVTENAAVLEALFRLCYPMEHQCIEDLSLLRMVLDAAHKYDMAFISERLKANLRALVPSAAIRVYCVAYLTKCADVAQDAARFLLSSYALFDRRHLPHEFEELPATALAKLVIYRETCTGVAQGVLNDDEWMGSAILSEAFGTYPDDMTPWVWLTCDDCKTAEEYENPDPDDIVGQLVRPCAWWCLYRNAARDALSLEPTPTTVTQIHLMDSALRQAASCKTCSPKAASHLLRYSREVADRIEEKISKVKLKLPFGE